MDTVYSKKLRLVLVVNCSFPFRMNERTLVSLEGNLHKNDLLQKNYVPGGSIFESFALPSMTIMVSGEYIY